MTALTVDTTAITADNGNLTADATVYPKLAPSAAWNGTALSGYTTAQRDALTTPIARLTAKPWCRPLWVNWAVVTGDVTIGVDAGANGGLSNVRFWLEGNFIDVATETFHFYNDVNGNPRWTFGYHVTLDYATWIALNANGAAQMFVEATANDSTMQKRIIGNGVAGSATVAPDPTLEFYARTTEFTHTIDVGTSFSKTLLQALSTVAGDPSNRYNIILHDAITPIGVENIRSNYGAQTHWTVVTAVGNVQLGDGAVSLAKAKFSGLCFRGSNIQWNVSQIGYNLAASFVIPSVSAAADRAVRLWLDGVELTMGTPPPAHGGSGSGATALCNGVYPATTWIDGSGLSHEAWNVYYTEVNGHDMSANGFSYCMLGRNCTMNAVSGTNWDNPKAVHGGTTALVGAHWLPGGLAVKQNAFIIKYNGTAALAQFEKPAANGAAGDFNLYEDSATPTHSIPTNGVNPPKTVQQIVDDINAYGHGWSATVSTTTFAACYLTISTVANSAAIPKTMVPNGSIGFQVQAVIDVHAGGISWTQAAFENVAFRFHSFDKLLGSGSFDSTNNSTFRKDFGIRNVSVQDLSAVNGLTSEAGYNQAVDSHIVVQYVTIVNGVTQFASKYTGDHYCLYEFSAYEDVDANQTFTGSVSGTTLTVSAYPAPQTQFSIGDNIFHASLPAGTKITGGTGPTYVLNNSAVIGAGSTLNWWTRGTARSNTYRNPFNLRQSLVFSSSTPAAVNSINGANAPNSQLYMGGDATPPDYRPIPNGKLLLPDMVNYSGRYRVDGSEQGT